MSAPSGIFQGKSSERGGLFKRVIRSVLARPLFSISSAVTLFTGDFPDLLNYQPKVPDVEEKLTDADTEGDVGSLDDFL